LYASVFNEGYFDGGQGYGHNFNGNAYAGAQRVQCPFRSSGQGGRGHSGRGGRGRFNGSGTGGHTSPATVVGQEAVGAGTYQTVLAVTPLVQQMVQSVATLQLVVNAQTLQQVLQGIQQQNITQGVASGDVAVAFVLSL
jgi:hypothetical protein